MVGYNPDDGPSSCRKRLCNLRQVLMKDNRNEKRSAGNAKQPYGELDFARHFHCGCYQFGRAPESAPTGTETKAASSPLSVENIGIYKALPAKDHLERTFREIALA